MIAKEFLNQYYIHAGFQRAWKYKDVLELEFEEGEMIRVTNHSDYVAELRKEVEQNVKDYENDMWPWESVIDEMKDKPWWL